ncbi:hypothetical protein BKA80DRAFT_312527 [Phyllosticta citrichinensis]
MEQAQIYAFIDSLLVTASGCHPLSEGRRDLLRDVAIRLDPFPESGPMLYDHVVVNHLLHVAARPDTSSAWRLRYNRLVALAREVYVVEASNQEAMRVDLETYARGKNFFHCESKIGHKPEDGDESSFRRLLALNLGLEIIVEDFQEISHGDGSKTVYAGLELIDVAHEHGSLSIRQRKSSELRDRTAQRPAVGRVQNAIHFVREKSNSDGK